MSAAAFDALEESLCMELADILDTIEVEQLDAFGTEWARGFSVGIRTALWHLRHAAGVVA